MPEGCPTCAVEGTPSNLCCAYDPGGSRELPYIETEGLGEGNTPLVPLRTEGASLAKLEFINPTGSHKDRYSAQAVAHAVHAGYRCVCVASSGNAGLSVAAYAARAGVECRVVVTPVVPRSLLDAVSATGASVHVVTGSDARWDLIRSWTGRDGGVLSLSNTVSPVIGSSPFGIEGYKAIAWELHDRLGRVPDAVLVPTSRGDLLSGIALGFAGMAAGPSARVPRVYCVEPFARASAVLDGAAPVTADFPGDATATPSIGGHGVT
ncbi:MAG: pyridoxal-phosphate dependent enzyme, partial [Actinomycetales bacterium]